MGQATSNERETRERKCRSSQAGSKDTRESFPLPSYPSSTFVRVCVFEENRYLASLPSFFGRSSSVIIYFMLMRMSMRGVMMGERALCYTPLCMSWSTGYGRRSWLGRSYFNRHTADRQTITAPVSSWDGRSGLAGFS